MAKKTPTLPGVATAPKPETKINPKLAVTNSMTAEDLKFKEWLEAQPDDRVFTVYWMMQPMPSFCLVFEGNGPVVNVPSVKATVDAIYCSCFGTSTTFTAKRFRQLYAESNQPK